MPAVGWEIDGVQYSYEDAVNLARKNGHLDGFVPAALKAMERTRVDGFWLSPSSAEGCPRQRVLIMQEDYYQKPEKEWRPGVGTAIHNWLQEADNPDHERFLTAQLQVPLRDGTVVPFMLQGTADNYDPEFRRITDFKTVSDFRSNYPYDSHVLQINLYQLLFELNDMPVEELLIWYVRQGGKDAKRLPLVVPKWDLDEVYAVAIELAEPLAWAQKTKELPDYTYDPKWFPCQFCPVVAQCLRRQK
jgi:hypothetical protein